MLSKSEVDELYRLYSSELFNYLLQFTRSREISEDLLHDIYIKLIDYSTKKEIRIETIRAFLYRTARNMAINYQKRKKNNTLPVTDQEYNDINHAEAIENQDLINEIYRLLDKLDPQTKSIFIMKKEQNLSFEEIAQHHDISERTVRRKLEKAISFLIQNMNQQDIINFTIFLSEIWDLVV